MRLTEDIKEYKNGKFITLTFNQKEMIPIGEDVKQWRYKDGLMVKEERNLQGYELDNAICKRAVRNFTERWRKKHKKTIRHWLITELGHGETEHIHMHGIVWADDIEEIVNKWKYGFVWKGKKKRGKGGLVTWENYVNGSTINYMMKYVTKIDEQHKTYKPIILCSNGIGVGFMKTESWKLNKYNPEGTREYYRTDNGHKIAIPIYLRNKIYTEDEREKLWIEKLNKEERFVCGEKISVANGQEAYEKIRQYYRQQNANLGYGTGMHSDERREYEKQRRIIQQQTREAKYKAPPARVLPDGG